MNFVAKLGLILSFAAPFSSSALDVRELTPGQKIQLNRDSQLNVIQPTSRLKAALTWLAGRASNANAPDPMFMDIVIFPAGSVATVESVERVQTYTAAGNSFYVGYDLVLKIDDQSYLMANRVILYRSNQDRDETVLETQSNFENIDLVSK